MKRLRVLLDFGHGPPHPVGEVAQHGRDLFWEWAPSFLAKPLPLSPLQPTPGPGAKKLTTLPPLLRESLPDGWGRLLMDRHFASHHAGSVDDLDRLAWMGKRAMGALIFEPGTQPEEQPSVLSLERMAVESWEFQDGLAEEVLPDLLKAGGTPGGARPKVVVGLQDDPSASGVWRGDGDLPAGVSPWIVKFCAKAEAQDAGAMEFVYAQLAKLAGIDMPEARLIETKVGRFFAIKRFDRAPQGRRLHMQSVAGLLGLSDFGAGQPARLVMQVARKLTGDQREVDKAYRWLVFNALAHNRDDHLKNFAFLMDASGAWRLSPAYDLTFQLGPGGWHSVNFEEKNADPTHAELLALAKLEDVRNAPGILAQAMAATEQFDRLAKQAKVTAGMRKVVAGKLGLMRGNRG